MKIKGRYSKDNRSYTKTNAREDEMLIASAPDLIMFSGDFYDGGIISMPELTKEEFEAMRAKFLAMMQKVDAVIWAPQPPMAPPYSPADAKVTAQMYETYKGIPDARL